MPSPRFEVPAGLVNGINTDQPPVKRCAACKCIKNYEDFGVDRSQPSGKLVYCRSCNNAKRREFYAQNREYDRARGAKKQIEWNGMRFDVPVTRVTAGNRLIRLEVLNKLGGRCLCCGETREEFLTLDHIQGGGKKHRSEVGTYIFRRIRNNPDPKTYRVLCYNCNCARGFRGYCPHEVGRRRKRK